MIPSREQPRERGPKPLFIDAEPVCVAIAQVRLRHGSEHHWMRAAPHQIGHLIPPSALPTGVCALNAAIWHNRLIGAPVKRSLIAYDH